MAPGRFEPIVASARTNPLRRFRLIALAPVLALLALSAWAFASPMGAAPDDDYHLVSIWCSTDNPAYCQPGATESARLVPQALLSSPCYAFFSEESAACQDRIDFGSTSLVETDRGNFEGEYPPLYYSVMSVFVGDDTMFSVMAMRLFNVFLFVALTAALYMLLPVRRRPVLVWGWLVTTMPLGVFLLASNNPSGWAVAGVGSAWLALLSYYEAESRVARAASAVLVVISVLMAAGSRGDSALYVVGALGVAIILVFENTRRFWLLSLLPVAMGVVAGVFFLSARQTSAGINGFAGAEAGPAAAQAATAADSLAGFGLLAYNLLNVPSLWIGAFGGWDLGWLDTPIPASVVFFGIAAFVAVGFAGLGVLNWRKAFVVASVGFVLWILPTYVLTQGGDKVGEQVQPRYILPLIVLMGGLLVVQAGRKSVALGRVQTVAVVVALSAANLVALHMNMRRYVTGNDVPGWNLDAGAEWFWPGAPAPMVVWVVGSLAFAGMVVILAREIYIAPLVANKNATGATAATDAGAGAGADSGAPRDAEASAALLAASGVTHVPA
ncbi:DUF2142 domain-containing protein [Salinibacterium sp. NG22]|uniref:DUF2142 domain-containing protein n=1 Tax=Salinibacterium sp. NG22 TaxID=2792040 RepID=UPI0018CE0C96|nr:DUF2142 domain-containing protein [Salinibacterium sp. NG22]MBH0109441.1 DUF2142 domain-containing protein [Salinibacterium sp. NG22]